jgi:hypothetical protein
MASDVNDKGGAHVHGAVNDHVNVDVTRRSAHKHMFNAPSRFGVLLVSARAGHEITKL